jgi:hypothetical protein
MAGAGAKGWFGLSQAASIVSTATGDITVKIRDTLRTLISGAAIAALLSSSALAQSPGFTLPNNSVYQGHLNAAPVAAAPAGSGCTIAAGSTDTDGSCTTTATSGSITFAVAFNQAPFCSVTDQTATPTAVISVSATAITLTTVVSAHVLNWHCTGKNGG